MIRRCLYRKYPSKIYFSAGVYLQWNGGIHIKSEILGDYLIMIRSYRMGRRRLSKMAMGGNHLHLFCFRGAYLQWNGSVHIKSEMEAFIWLGVIDIKWAHILVATAWRIVFRFMFWKRLLLQTSIATPLSCESDRIPSDCIIEYPFGGFIL